MSAFLPLYRRQSLQAVCLALALSLTATPALARSGRVFQMPNGSVLSCAHCHLNGGGSARNAFGLAVQSITGSQSIPFWSPALAALDSDGDGFRNGTELGDPEGDFLNVGPASRVTNAGLPSSKPNPATLTLVSPSLSGGKFGVSVPTEVNFVYVLQFRAETSTGTWTKVAELVGDGSLRTLTDPNTLTNRGFYRVSIQ